MVATDPGWHFSPQEGVDSCWWKLPEATLESLALGNHWGFFVCVLGERVLKSRRSK